MRRLEPSAPSLAQRLEALAVLYHSGGARERINGAIGRDYLASTPLRYEIHGLFQVASYEDQVRELTWLQELCREYDMELLGCDDFIGSRRWRSCCGVDDLPGFEGIAKWAYFTNGYRITLLILSGIWLVLKAEALRINS